MEQRSRPASTQRQGKGRAEVDVMPGLPPEAETGRREEQTAEWKRYRPNLPPEDPLKPPNEWPPPQLGAASNVLPPSIGRLKDPVLPADFAAGLCCIAPAEAA